MDEKQKAEQAWTDQAEEFAGDNCPFTPIDDESDPPENYGIDCYMEAITDYKASLRAAIEKRIPIDR